MFFIIFFVLISINRQYLGLLQFKLTLVGLVFQPWKLNIFLDIEQGKIECSVIFFQCTFNKNNYHMITIWQHNKF